MKEAPRISPVDASQIEDRYPPLNVIRTIAQNPALFRAWGGFASYILGPELSISPRQRELVILRVGWKQQANYEWAHHVALAATVGVTSDDILAVREGPDASRWTELERLLLRAVDEIAASAEISQDTWNRLKDHYSDQQMLDLIFTIGQYTLVCIALKSIKVELEPEFQGVHGSR